MSATASPAARRNSSSVPAAPPRSSERVRRLSAAAPPPAPHHSAASARISAMAHAAALATAEAERRSCAGSPPPAKSAQSRAAGGARASPTPQPKPRGKPAQLRATGPRQPQPQPQQPTDEQATVRLVIGVLGLKFACRVQRAWPCEAMIATAVAEYHLAYPACEIPDFNTMYHSARKELLKPGEAIGSCCADDDEVELGMTEKPCAAADGAPPAPSVVSSASSDGREMFDFTITFHRLPLGFTLKQSNEHIVVANIYPHSTATHYERLETGVRVVQIAATPLESLGLRQVHDLIKNAKIPLEINFRGYKKPSLRSTLLLAAANPTAANPTVANPTVATASTETRSAGRRRSQSSPKPEDDSASPPRSIRDRSRATSSGSSSRVVEMLVSGEPGSRNGVNSNGKRSGRSRRSSQESRDDGRHEPDGNDNQSNNQGGSSPALPNAQRAHQSNSPGDTEEEPADVRASDRDSNQNEEETEELLVDQIKTLQVALLKKHEEAKQIARQIELFHEKLTAVRKKSKGGDAGADPSVRVPPPPHSAPASTTAAAASSSSAAASLKLRLTPEVLEAMDSKAGVPPKSASYYQSSNVSSVSGYSSYSNRSNAPRSARQASSLRRQHTAENLRSDASVTSHSSATKERRGSSSTPRSPRSQCVKNLNSRYNYIPQKYAATVSEMAAPTSLSSRGAVMSRAKATRDSFLPKSESPGVGYYDVKAPATHVRGGEIGDSDRSLPWP